MAQNGEDDKPWRRLYHGDQQEQQQNDDGQQQPDHPQQLNQQEQQQQQEQPQQEGLSELQLQLLTAYRKTCLVAGAGLAGAVYQWNTKTRHTRQQVFVPPRAQALPQEVVEAWKKKAELRDAMRTVGRQTLFITGVAALYFGVELGAGLWRQAPGDWVNTAAAGAVAGVWLGARAPSSLRGRTVALGSIAGSMLGAISGWSQQQLAHMAEAASSSSGGGGGSSGGSSE